MHLRSFQFGYQELDFKPLITPSQSVNEITIEDKIEDLVALFDIIQDRKNKKVTSSFRLSARQVVQTKVNNNYTQETEALLTLIPKRTLEIFEERITRCWNGYNDVLEIASNYLPQEIDDADNALKRCICRELRRLFSLTGTLPVGSMKNYWDLFKCDLQ